MKLLPAALLLAAAPAAAQVDYEADVDHALEQLEEKCGHFFEQKGIDWKKISREFRKAAEEVEDDVAHRVLLTRLLARLRDGHAELRLLEAGKEVGWPEDGLFGSKVERGQAGLALSRVGRKLYVKAVAGPAADAQLQPGSEVLKIDGEKPDDWLEARAEEFGDLISWSTPQQGDYWVRHYGASGPAGGRLKLEVKEPDGKKKKRTITLGDDRYRMGGPPLGQEGLEWQGTTAWVKLENGYGYVYFQKCRDECIEGLDVALAALGEVPGMVLDFRGNGGGGFDHDAFLGRFVPAGEELTFAKHIASAGPRQFGGPVVVIVDAGTVSAGETASGMFMEEGRALMIGPTPTAGMSSSKETIELPSGLFALYVSVHSNKSRWQGGRGIEGLGVEPHRLVEYDPEELAAGVDTLLRTACELLAEEEWKEVPYKPERFGWKKP